MSYKLPATAFRGRSPRLRWLPERHLCCDPGAVDFCPYNESWWEYVLRIVVCRTLGHRWKHHGMWRMCGRCRWHEPTEGA